MIRPQYPHVTAKVEMGDGGRIFTTALTDDAVVATEVLVYWHVPEDSDRPVLMVEIDSSHEESLRLPHHTHIRVRHGEALVYDTAQLDPLEEQGVGTPTPQTEGRVHVEALFPKNKGETSGAWTDRLSREGRALGVFRQCSIGWEEEGSAPRDGPGAECNCLCHVGATVFTVAGHIEDGEVVATTVLRGKTHTPPVEGEPAGSWAVWVLALAAEDARVRGIHRWRRALKGGGEEG